MASRSSIWVIVALVCVLAAGLGYVAGLYQMGPGVNAAQKQASASLPATETALRDAELALNAERDRREGDRLVEFATRQALEKRLKAQDADISRMREQLAFYEQLLPPGPPGAVTIRGFELEAMPGALRYRVLLMRSGRTAGKSFEGTLQFVAQGEQDGKPVSLTLEPMVLTDDADTSEGASSVSATPQSAAEAAKTLSVDFDQYQRSQGVLGLPEDFAPRAVVVNVLEGTTVRASREYTLQ